MGVDSDSFDIEDALRGTPDEEAANRFIKWAYRKAHEVDLLEKENQRFAEMLRMLNRPYKYGKPNIRRFLMPVRKIR